MQLTIKQVAQHFGHANSTHANGLVQCLKQLGHVEKAGSVKASTGKGKPATLYEFSDEALTLLGFTTPTEDDEDTEDSPVEEMVTVE